MKKDNLSKEEVTYYKQLYDEVNDLDNAKDIFPGNTASKFSEQLKNNFP